MRLTPIARSLFAGRQVGDLLPKLYPKTGYVISHFQLVLFHWPDAIVEVSR